MYRMKLAVAIALVVAVGAGAQCPPPLAGTNATPAPWPSWGMDPSNSRYARASVAGLTTADVPKLTLAWAFSLGPSVSDARGQPTVVDQTVFVAATSGDLYAIDLKSGCTQWHFKAEGALHGAAAFGRASDGRLIAIVGDQKANAYGLDPRTGALLWKVHLDPHITARVTGSPQIDNGIAYFPLSSFEEVMVFAPKYECCSFRGSIVALDAGTGRRIWKTYTIADTARATTVSTTGTQQRGPSGAPVWSSPTIDHRAGVLYVATGNNYSDPATSTSDAVLALDLTTGAVRWSKQLTANDAQNVGCDIPGKPMCPSADGPDADFGQPPIVVTLTSGRRLLLIAQKSGFAYALDPDKSGAVVWQARIAKGGKLGGSQWGSATDGRRMYVAASDLAPDVVPDSSPQGFHFDASSKQGGGLTALDVATGTVAWAAAPPTACAGRRHCSPAQSAAVTVVDGAVFSGSVDGHLRAYWASTGAVLWDFDATREFTTINGMPAHGGSFDVGGAATANGMLFVCSGYGLWGGMPGNVLLAFSVRRE
jgi:polyvinyl alcohol dehydrogenase (cytochrome)